MIELPEALALAEQMNRTIKGRVIAKVTSGHTPHKFAWFYGEKENYNALLKGKKVDKASAHGGMAEINAGDAAVLFNDGVNLRFFEKEEKLPDKHQLLIEFEDCSALAASVQMYGGMGCFKLGELDNPYYKVSFAKPSPLSDAFNRAYFDAMLSAPGMAKLSAKAFLATEQRIPGLGNGVLQDILYNASVHPKKKIGELTTDQKTSLFDSVKATLAEMASKGGRDTEKDLFGCPGGYATRLSKNTADMPCLRCGTIIKKESYLGGSIYYCPGCQHI